ncbi:MAG: aldo/keto reductase [Eggerthellaceae bacterium]
MAVEMNQASKLGFGLMRLPLDDPNNQKSIDIDQLCDMVDAYLAGGGNYFDTAHVYHEGESEVAIGKALVARHPRDSYTIATKCLAWSEPTAEAAKKNLETSLERMGTDYIDYYLLHNLGGSRTEVFERYGMWDFLKDMKAQGKIRHLGFSMHDGADTLEEILTAHPEAEFVQLQVNYLDWDDPITQSRRCMEVAASHNKPVIIMEPARGGRLINSLPAEAKNILMQANADASLASWAYRFCMSLPGVLTVLSGMSTLEQVKQNMDDMARFAPLSESELATVKTAAKAIRDKTVVNCTNCRYCMKGCPQGVQIPIILGLLNLEEQLGDFEFVKGNYQWQARAGYASECIQCGACEDICPQKIDIIHQLEVAAERYE